MHDLTCLEYLVDPLFVDASCSTTAGIVELPLELHAVLIVLAQVALAHQQFLLTDPGFHLESTFRSGSSTTMSKLTFETSLLKSRMPRASSRPRDIRLDSFWRDSHALTKLLRITCKK